jgi:hypothetical protein
MFRKRSHSKLNASELANDAFCLSLLRYVQQRKSQIFDSPH